MNKRGQFYLVAAIVIIAVIVGIAGISNYSKKSEDRELTDLKIELNSEIEKTFEYISNQELSFSQSLVIWKNLSSIYISKIGTNKNSVFLFGDSTNLLTVGGLLTSMFLGLGMAIMGRKTT